MCVQTVWVMLGFNCIVIYELCIIYFFILFVQAYYCYLSAYLIFCCNRCKTLKRENIMLRCFHVFVVLHGKSYFLNFFTLNCICFQDFLSVTASMILFIISNLIKDIQCSLKLKRIMIRVRVKIMVPRSSHRTNPILNTVAHIPPVLLAHLLLLHGVGALFRENEQRRL